jgi:hypothetical protein
LREMRSFFGIMNFDVNAGILYIYFFDLMFSKIAANFSFPKIRFSGLTNSKNTNSKNTNSKYNNYYNQSCNGEYKNITCILSVDNHDNFKNFENKKFELYLKCKNNLINPSYYYSKLIDFKALKFNKPPEGESRGSIYADIEFFDITNETIFNFGERIEDSDYIKNIVKKILDNLDNNIKTQNLYWVWIIWIII